MSLDTIDPYRVADMLERDLGRDAMRLFRDGDVTELFVNVGHEHLWVDSHSKGLHETKVTVSKATVRTFLQRAADFAGENITDRNPRVECSLPQPTWGGSRLTGILPPASPEPVFCLRKFSDEVIPLDSFVPNEIISSHQHSFLLDAIENHKSIGIVGGTGSGKTTMAMSILDQVCQFDPDCRILTMEDTRELQIPRSRNWIPLCTYPGGSFVDLISMSLRLTPDRIVVGECRGPALIALFEAFISGHPGGVFTYHAHNVEETLKRFLINCKRDSDTDSHQHTIGSAVDVLVILTKEEGYRFVPQMVEVNGFSDRSGYDLNWIPRDPESPTPPGHYWRPEPLRQPGYAVAS
jgi:type IV secretion system protein VirB11